jgi:hypothetical protein
MHDIVSSLVPVLAGQPLLGPFALVHNHAECGHISLVHAP